MNRFFKTNHQLQRDVEWLLHTGPDRGAGGRVEVRQFRKPDGSFVYTVNQYSGDGGWSSDATPDLRAANLAAECLALRNGSVLLVCKECDQEERR